MRVWKHQQKLAEADMVSHPPLPSPSPSTRGWWLQSRNTSLICTGFWVALTDVRVPPKAGPKYDQSPPGHTLWCPPIIIHPPPEPPIVNPSCWDVLGLCWHMLAPAMPCRAPYWAPQHSSSPSWALPGAWIRGLPSAGQMRHSAGPHAFHSALQLGRGPQGSARPSGTKRPQMLVMKP